MPLRKEGWPQGLPGSPVLPAGVVNLGATGWANGWMLGRQREEIRGWPTRVSTAYTPDRTLNSAGYFSNSSASGSSTTNLTLPSLPTGLLFCLGDSDVPGAGGSIAGIVQAGYTWTSVNVVANSGQHCVDLWKGVRNASVVSPVVAVTNLGSWRGALVFEMPFLQGVLLQFVGATNNGSSITPAALTPTGPDEYYLGGNATKSGGNGALGVNDTDAYRFQTYALGQIVWGWPGYRGVANPTLLNQSGQIHQNAAFNSIWR